MSLLIKDLHKAYKGFVLFRDFSITFPEERITCILGPSGCGKTTLLNIIGKTVVPDSGSLAGFEDRQFSFIFQEPRLLPWKTVGGNIEFVLDRSMPAGVRKERAMNLAGLVELEKFVEYYPSQLSGGMRQRVSIARAFAPPSDIILMDEPLGGLDVALKQNMIRWFTQLWETDRRTVIFVTHDIDEALFLGDEIVVFSHPPVQILAREKFDEPRDKRHPDMPQFRQLKEKLLGALRPDRNPGEGSETE
jgi:NitT/TauT family transport system ATP-binding protein